MRGLLRLNRWRHTMPLTLLALVITGVAGILFWLFQDALHTQRLLAIVQDHQYKELRRDVQIDRVRLDERLRIQERTTRLVVERQAFVAHVAALERAGWSETPEVELTRLADSPPWLPTRHAMRDGRGRPRELYEASGKDLPFDFLEGFARDCLAGETNSALRWQGRKLYFLTCALPSRPEGVPPEQPAQALLILVTPLDDAFLLTFDSMRHHDGLIVLLDSKGERVVASSRPDLVASDTSLKSLSEDYLIIGNEISDETLSATVFIRYAALTPKSRLEKLSGFLVDEGRRQSALGHLLMISVFVIIIYWMGRHLESLTRRMVLFARQRLHLPMSAVAPGNALRQLIAQFDLLTREIEEVRAREAGSAAQLAQSNQALESSLTLLKRTHAQLLTSEKMAALGSLVAGVAHEINTPVGIGVTAASFLDSRTRECQSRLEGNSLTRGELESYFQDAGESSAMILSNLMRAADLVRSFKQVAVDTSSEASRLFDFHTVIHQILQSLHPRLKKTPHKVRVVCPESLVHFGRPDVFSQIITNFVLNSLQHGLSEAQPGEMRIEMCARKDEIELRYSDNGRGMSEEDRVRIFEPFFTTARHKGGSGLGMHIVFNLVTATLGGEIRCDTAPGQGTAFTILFPARYERPQGV
ncbi:MAG: HAMP domain-containing histidine kinase [Magnetococcales bacterium]|nr:HAMP domain-containing histidine kinase [Magnetococcales bacterium]